MQQKGKSANPFFGVDRFVSYFSPRAITSFCRILQRAHFAWPFIQKTFSCLAGPVRPSARVGAVI